MIGFFIAMISGALMSVQGVFNTQVTKASSIWVASAFVQLSAFAVCMGAWFLTDRTSFIVAYMLELLGMFGVEKQPLEWRKVIGVLVAVTGFIIFKWK